MERFKSILQIVTLLVALFQLLFSNAQRSEETAQNAANIVKLTRQIDAQGAYIEAAFRCGGADE